jgi:signal transduction histidine kinase
MRLKTIKYIAAILLLIFMHIFFYNSEHTKKVDYKFYDISSMLFNKIEEQKNKSNSIIVDIDEKSLQQLGQWPWPRIIDAQLIDSVDSLNPSAIGINILFPEQDRSSPTVIENFYKNFFNLDIEIANMPSKFMDNDKLLLASIERTGSTIATYFHNSAYTSTHCQKLAYKDDVFSNIKTKLNAPSLLCNYKTIQNNVENFGFINAWSDEDGIFRRVPLFMEYQEHIFPSLAVATLLNSNNNVKINTENHTVLINPSKESPKVISALDILNKKVTKNEIEGKVVIIGSSVVGLNPTYTTSDGKSISNSMIHALVVDSILDDTVLSQPEEYKVINTILSLLFSIIIMILFIKRLYIQILMMFLISIAITFLSLYYSYLNGFYISVGYFWMPTLYLFTLFVIYYSIKINREKQEQEKILIIQSKLASMGEMIALIAHQWRQPLSTINGIVINIDVDNRKRILSDEVLENHLNQIENTTAYLSKTINDFTDFFSKNKKSESFYMRDIIRQAEDLTVISSHKNIEITYNEKEDIEIVGYSSELIQSLLVLLNNAIYACQKNHEHTNQGKIMINAYEENKSVFIMVEDNGGGIDKKNIKKIFDPYFTTKEKENGTGLGLYILRLIVEDNMYGKISVHNGRYGAIFTIKIPNKN